MFSSRQVARARELLARLYAARRAFKLYPPTHPAIPRSVEQLLAALAEYHAEGVDVPLTFLEDELLLGEQILSEESELFGQLIGEMTAIGATSVTFARGLDFDELGRAIRVLGADSIDMEAAGGLESLVAAAELQHVRILSVRPVERIAETELDDSERARTAYVEALDLMREMNHLVSTSGVLSINRVRSTIRDLVSNVLTNRFAMVGLSGLKNYDEYTFYHSVNVAILSLGLGSMISTDPRFLSSLGVGALLHDLGKLGLDLDVLNKPGALSAEEWDMVRAHPIEGAEGAATVHGLDKAAVVIIMEHHMRHDLTGYPRRQHPRPQNLASRIVAIADAYDAMTSRRAYSAARLPDEALAILANSAGTAFDPALVPLFVSLLGVYPPRTVVRLTTGETAVVVRPTPGELLRPVVRIFSGADGRLIDPFDADLADPTQDREIERSLDPQGLNVDVEEYL